MLGIEDGWVVLAYILCILSAVICVVYGAANWNKGEETLSGEDIEWVREEQEGVEETL